MNEMTSDPVVEPISSQVSTSTASISASELLTCREQSNAAMTDITWSPPCWYCCAEHHRCNDRVEVTLERTAESKTTVIQEPDRVTSFISLIHRIAERHEVLTYVQKQNHGAVTAEDGPFLGSSKLFRVLGQSFVSMARQATWGCISDKQSTGAANVSLLIKL